MPKTYAVPPAPPANEGHTVAAWLLTALVVVGAIIGAVGLAMASNVVIVVGAAVMAVGVVAGVGLSLAGMGQKHERSAQR